jgi:ribose transport system ATP-binding protein
MSGLAPDQTEVESSLEAQGKPIADADLVARGIVKRFGGATALDGVDFSARCGEVHGLLGENGAGKSTLMKVIAGVVVPDEGELLMHGERVSFASPAAAQRASIRTVFQELSTIPDLTAAENVAFAGATSISRPFRRPGALNRHVRELLANIGIEDIPVDAPATALSLEQRQRLEIAKAVAAKPRVLVLDEATSALSAREVEWLVTLARRLAAEGVIVLFISHRLAEIRAACDRVTILRNGRLVRSVHLDEVDDASLVKEMLGRRLSRLFPERTSRPQEEVVLEAEDFGALAAHRGASFSLRRGEILGIGGLQGQGQAGLLLGVFGALRSRGTLTVEGRKVKFRLPADALAAGIALVPEDRGRQGLLLGKSLRENLVLGVLGSLARGGFVRPDRERAVTDAAIGELSIQATSSEQIAGTLSGGNQQKVLLAKILALDARILLFYDPTRGVDVGTKAEIFRIMDDLAGRGYALLFFSTDAQELIGVCDRVAVMGGGAVIGTLDADGLTEERLLAAAVGGAAA